MSKTINPKSIIFESKTSILIFSIPIFVFISMIIYATENKTISNFILIILICSIPFIHSFLNYYQKKIMITGNSIHIYVRGNSVLSRKLLSEFNIINVKKNIISSLFNFGTLIIVNNKNEMYTYYFLKNPEEVKNQIMFRYEKLAKKIDPNFIPEYTISKNNTDKKTKLDTLD